MSPDSDGRTVPSIPVVADLIAVGLFTVTAVVVVTVLHPSETVLRTVLSLPFLLFAPGYMLVAVLFPKGMAASTDDVDDRPTTARSISGTERIVLSFGLSVAITAGIGLVLSVSPWNIGVVSVALGVGGFAVSVGIVAAVRRYSLPPADRYSVPYHQWAIDGRRAFHAQSRTESVLTVALVLGIILAAGSVASLFVVTGPTETFTEFYLLTEDENGALVADGYPHEFTRGESEPVVVGITNRAEQTMNYTIVVSQQRIRTRNNTTTVLEANRLGQFDAQLADNETGNIGYDVTPTATGSDLRIAFLLYEGNVPPRPTGKNADQTVHLDVNVSTPNEQRHRPPTDIFYTLPR